MIHQAVDTDDAMLVVGTYGSYSGTSTKGYTIVFDKSSRGQIFSATGNLLANATNYVPTDALDIPTVVNMNGIPLTPNAIPITMGNVAYILDKVKTHHLSATRKFSNLNNVPANVFSAPFRIDCV